MKFPRIFSSRVISIFLIFLGIMFFCVLVPVVIEGFAKAPGGWTAAALDKRSDKKVTGKKGGDFGVVAKDGSS